MLYKYGIIVRINFWGVYFTSNFNIFLVFKNKIIPLTLAGYEMVRVNSYPMLAHGIIIVKCTEPYIKRARSDSRPDLVIGYIVPGGKCFILLPRV